MSVQQDPKYNPREVARNTAAIFRELLPNFFDVVIVKGRRFQNETILVRAGHPLCEDLLTAFTSIDGFELYCQDRLVFRDRRHRKYQDSLRSALTSFAQEIARPQWTMADMPRSGPVPSLDSSATTVPLTLSQLSVDSPVLCGSPSKTNQKGADVTRSLGAGPIAQSQRSSNVTVSTAELARSLISQDLSLSSTIPIMTDNKSSRMVTSFGLWPEAFVPLDIALKEPKSLPELVEQIRVILRTRPKVDCACELDQGTLKLRIGAGEPEIIAKYEENMIVVPGKDRMSYTQFIGFVKEMLTNISFQVRLSLLRSGVESEDSQDDREIPGSLGITGGTAGYLAGYSYTDYSRGRGVFGISSVAEDRDNASELLQNKGSAIYPPGCVVECEDRQEKEHEETDDENDPLGVSALVGVDVEIGPAPQPLIDSFIEAFDKRASVMSESLKGTENLSNGSVVSMSSRTTEKGTGSATQSFHSSFKPNSFSPQYSVCKS